MERMVSNFVKKSLVFDGVIERKTVEVVRGGGVFGYWDAFV